MATRSPSLLEQVRRAFYFAQRDIGDYQAYRNGRLGRRLTRRAVTRRIMPRLFR